MSSRPRRAPPPQPQTQRARAYPMTSAERLAIAGIVAQNRALNGHLAQLEAEARGRLGLPLELPLLYDLEAGCWRPAPGGGSVWPAAAAAAAVTVEQGAPAAPPGGTPTRSTAPSAASSRPACRSTRPGAAP